MNIALLTTYAHGGAGVAARRLRDALSTQGHTATLLTADGFPWRHYVERATFLPHERDASVRFYFSLANIGRDLRHHPAVRAADVLHLHWINQGFLTIEGIAGLAALGKPIVWTMHDMWAFTGGCHYSRGCTHYERTCGDCLYLKKPHTNDLSHRIWMRKSRFFPKNLHLVACSQWLANVAASSSLFANTDLRAIPNPIDVEAFRPASHAERTALRHEWGWDNKTKVVLFVAMNLQNPYKGFSHFQEMLGHLRAQYPDLPVSIAAVGQIKDATPLAQLPYPVHELGLVKDPQHMRGLYAAADVFVIPSLEDNLPNTVMESMACGTPVVGFATGGIPEMVQDGQHGCISPPRDSARMAEQLAWLLTHDEARVSMGAACRKKVLAEYTPSVVAARYEALYKAVLEKPG